jgi:hypothetical protein
VSWYVQYPAGTLPGAANVTAYLTVYEPSSCVYQCSLGSGYVVSETDLGGGLWFYVEEIPFSQYCIGGGTHSPQTLYHRIQMSWNCDGGTGSLLEACHVGGFPTINCPPPGCECPHEEGPVSYTTPDGMKFTATEAPVADSDHAWWCARYYGFFCNCGGGSYPRPDTTGTSATRGQNLPPHYDLWVPYWAGDGFGW